MNLDGPDGLQTGVATRPWHPRFGVEVPTRRLTWEWEGRFAARDNDDRRAGARGRSMSVLALDGRQGRFPRGKKSPQPVQAHLGQRFGELRSGAAKDGPPADVLHFARKATTAPITSAPR